MIIVSEPEYMHIRWMNDKYLRHKRMAEWYYWSDFSWLYMTFADSLTVEEAYQEYLKSCELSLPVLDLAEIAGSLSTRSTRVGGSPLPLYAVWQEVQTALDSSMQKTAEFRGKSTQQTGNSSDAAQARLEI